MIISVDRPTDLPVNSKPCRYWLSPWGGAIMVAALASLWGGVALTLSPAINHDEVMLNIAAREWQLHGSPALPPLADLEPAYARAYYWHPPGHLVAGRIAYALFGFSIETTRGLSLTYSALLAAALFALTYQITGKRTAALGAVCLYFANPLCAWLPRSGRMDHAAILFAVLGLLVWLRRPAHDTWKAHVLTGALLGIGSIFHVVASFFGPMLVGAEIARSKRIPWRDAGLIGVVAALPLLVWIAAAFASGAAHDWKVQFVDYQLNQRRVHMAPWFAPFAELALFFRQSAWTPLIIPTLALAVVAGWKSMPRPNRSWVCGGLLSGFLIIALLMDKGTGVYPLYWYFWLVLVAGAGLAEVLESGSRWRRVVCWLGLLSPFAFQATHVGIALYQRSGRDPARVEQFFVSHVKPGAVVLGPEAIWYAVDAAGATLRIWVSPEPLRHDYYVTHPGSLTGPPPGFRFVATLPDIMPKIFGRYFSHTAYAYDLWASESLRPLPTPP